MRFLENTVVLGGGNWYRKESTKTCEWVQIVNVELRRKELHLKQKTVKYYNVWKNAVKDI